MNKTRQDQARRLAREAGIPLQGDYYATITSAQAFKLCDIARLVGYRRPKLANGSTARYFFEYLQRGYS